MLQRSSNPTCFPPATFQLRLRSLKSIYFIASKRPRNGFTTGRFRLTLHRLPEEDPFWISSFMEWSSDRQDRLQWSDIDLDRSTVHLGMRSLVVKVWFFPAGDEAAGYVERTWGVYLSGLDCLGSNPPARGRLPPDSLVFYMTRNYFSSVPAGCQKHESGTAASVARSYNTTLLLRLHRMHRALHHRESSNDRLKEDLRARGVLSESEIERELVSAIDDRPAKPSLRDEVFRTKRTKSAKVRMTETVLAMKHESLSLRLELLDREIGDVRCCVESLRAECDRLSNANALNGSMLMENMRLMSREVTGFREWKEDFRKRAINGGIWAKALKEVRMNYVRNASVLFPIDCFDGKIGTIRWVALPEAGQHLKEFAGRNEVVVSVAVGWLAQLAHVVSSSMDVPLPYPIRLHGSHSWIRGSSRGEEEFPLFVKGNNDWNKFEYAVLLLSKNVAQLRWFVRLNTKDLRPVLLITQELLRVGKTDGQIERMLATLPDRRYATRPPPKLERRDEYTSTSSADSSPSSSPSKSVSVSTSRCGSEPEVKEVVEEANHCQNDAEKEPEPAVVESERTSDSFWSDANKQSLALLSKPSNFQQYRAQTSSNQRL